MFHKPISFEKLQDVKQNNNNNMKLEILEKDCYYHIYNRGINGTNIFENDNNKIYFLKQLAKYSEGKMSIFAIV